MPEDTKQQGSNKVTSSWYQIPMVHAREEMILSRGNFGNWAEMKGLCENPDS